MLDTQFELICAEHTKEKQNEADFIWYGYWQDDLVNFELYYQLCGALPSEDIQEKQKEVSNITDFFFGK